MITFITETGSTNADLAACLRSGDYLAEGDWLVADRQIEGRGRRGSAWHDGTGNFMGSTVVHARFGDPDPATLALVCGLAVLAAVTPFQGDQQAMLKWPNDVLIGGAKLAGVLLEREGNAVIVGIGVNLLSAPAVPDRQTAALAEFGAPPARDAFAAEIARQFDLELDRWRTFGLSPILTRWQAAAHPVGTALVVGAVDEAPLHGTFAGLGADGALQLRLPDGTTRTIRAGEIRLAAT